MRLIILVYSFLFFSKANLYGDYIFNVIGATHVNEELAFVVKVENKSSDKIFITESEIDRVFSGVVLERDTKEIGAQKRWASLSVQPLFDDGITGVKLGKGKAVFIVVYAPPSRLLVSADFDEKVVLVHKLLRGNLNYTVTRKSAGKVECKLTK